MKPCKVFFLLFITIIYIPNIKLFGQDGITVAGGFGSGSASIQLAGPNSVFVDQAGNVYVADLSNNRVQKWAPGASVGITIAGGNGQGAAANQFWAPSDIFVDATGNLYVADRLNFRIQKFAPGTSAGITVAGGNGFGSAANQLFWPEGIFVDENANIYIADNANSRIQKWSPGATSGVTVAGGNGVGAAANQLSGAADVFLDKEGNIFVYDLNNNRIQKWTPGASTGITVAGGNGSGPAANQFKGLRGLYVDTTGNIFVADMSNNRIQKWAPGASEGITVAGGNGAGQAANQLNSPIDVFLDLKGNMFVDDRGNQRIQKFVAGVKEKFCPSDVVFVAPSCIEKVKISWTAPKDSFPDTISVNKGLNRASSKIIYKGTYNGHGYYQSDDNYFWPQASDAAKAVGAHLITITSADENSFVDANLNQQFNFAWIGMYNTGTAGSFAWVTGERISFTNWIPGEPNNLYNDIANPSIFEPYVHINGWDSLNRWNDLGAGVSARFLAEFDNAVIRYRQIGGPQNGSDLLPGVYQVCYERTNLILNSKDSCCFTVTVSCKVASANPSINTPVAIESLKNEPEKSLRVLASPNPSNSYFKLRIASVNNSKPVSIKITDMAGRIIEARNNVNTNQTLDIGTNLKPGLYFVQVTQGTSKIVEKIIKQ